jgi:hypothetical protein
MELARIGRRVYKSSDWQIPYLQIKGAFINTNTVSTMSLRAQREWQSNGYLRLLRRYAPRNDNDLRIQNVLERSDIYEEVFMHLLFGFT